MMNPDSKSPLNTQLKNPQIEGYQFTWLDWFCLWYPPGWLILFNRHWQHYHSEPDGWKWFEYCLFLIPLGFYLALFIRWLRLGFRSPGTNNNQEFNPNYQKLFRQEILAPIVKHYFQAQLHQLENLPIANISREEPVIVIMNHAGMSFPWDFITLAYLLSEKYNWIVQPLAGTALFDHALMEWWLPSGWSKILGGVRADRNSFKAAIQEHKNVLYAPEGLRGPMKGWAKRYQLQTFDISFVQLSENYQVPILPIICIGNEKLHPFTINVRWLQRLLKMPFFPLSPLIILFFLFPSMGVWAMRSQLNYFIQPVENVNLNDSELDNKRSAAYQKAQKLREYMQMQINERI
ncbi:1-acyl-sn-glycerol-3-phosphate acyltransferase [Calothrix sp. UHCC 0171]|uniref:1-acyl-sn-glycerol-3-phosphate acyltransferase n=1 Tax=Calothrix sp. UHCC 0171 TaxID=3110245 RepID=UPI002B216126|nr:1-acyl-sn-glycerol-3-phosphate acyltransferase [Calothrix sp. UHCC 0171]MEA5572601.1 1-acyl-sn-glycerol-3-phosphate acyltransferase [Calothrix sp. UHCC 0171]